MLSVWSRNLRTASWRFCAAYWVDSRDKVHAHDTTLKASSKLWAGFCDVDAPLFVVMMFMLSVWSRNLRTASCRFCAARWVDSRDKVHAHPTTLKVSLKLWG